MLIYFSVDNYRSIKDQVKLSMISGNRNSTSLTIDKRGYTLLSSAVLYGANASGKSNIIKAFNFMKHMVVNRHKIVQSTDTLPFDPYRLSTETENASTAFEIVFITDGIKYRYGFDADSKNIYSEWLFADEKGKESKLFLRDTEENEFYINPQKFKEGNGLKEKVLPNSLFLWKCDSEGGTVSRSVLEWFTKANTINGMSYSDYMSYTLEEMENEDFRSTIAKLVTEVDVGVQDIKLNESEVPDSEIDYLPLPEKFKEMIRSGDSPLRQVGIQTVHNKFDDNNKLVGSETFSLSEDESEGTKKFFAVSAPFIDTLKCGGVLWVDELDASLHPLLTMKLVALFNDPSINKNGAQLLFATHDTNFLNQNIFHKSQIWLTEKDKFGATLLNSLLDFSGIKKTQNIEKHYLEGRFGAIPNIGNFVVEVGEIG